MNKIHPLFKDVINQVYLGGARLEVYNPATGEHRIVERHEIHSKWADAGFPVLECDHTWTPLYGPPSERDVPKFVCVTCGCKDGPTRQMETP